MTVLRSKAPTAPRTALLKRLCSYFLARVSRPAARMRSHAWQALAKSPYSVTSLENAICSGRLPNRACAALRISKEFRGRLENDENPRTAIPGIVALLVETVQHQPEMLRLLYLSLFELENGAERILRKHLVPLFDPVREYLSRCVSKGLIRDLEPGVATLGLAASVAAHQGLQQVLTDRRYALRKHGRRNCCLQRLLDESARA